MIRPSRYFDPSSVGYRFRDALAADGVSVIAEIKRRSPSRGVLRADADPVSIARAYQEGGATCLSVLTDEERFGGSSEDLQKARAAVDIPVLRKDFLSTAKDVHDSAAMGADALLLILADIGAEQCALLQRLALTLGMDVITEVRNEEELEAAVVGGAYMIAVNQRNNPKDRAFTVDYNQAVRVSRLFDQIDPRIVKVAASGIGVPDGTRLEDVAGAGYDAVLVGEYLVRAKDPKAALQELRRPLEPSLLAAVI